jgi:predicted dehydrogenase
MRGETFNLRRLAVVGGGRWARVVIGVLHGIVPRDVRIRVHTPHNGSAMQRWAADRYGERVDVVDALPDFRDHDSADAVIIANAAQDHIATAGRAIRAGIPTLVEKPLALTEAEANEIVGLAESGQVLLASSRVPLFSRYIPAFARLVASERIASVHFTWADARDESRYGQPKQFDPGLPLFNDVLPHILPILGMLLNGAHTLTGIALEDGGSQTELRLQAGDVPCTLSLTRNAPSRRRIVEAQTPGQPFILDFSEEPGQICSGGQTYVGDLFWNREPRPLASMLQCFLSCVAEGKVDERLSARRAIAECRLADEVLPVYLLRQEEWLTARVGQPIDDGIRYLLAEILARHDRKLPRGDDVIVPIWTAMNARGAAAVRKVFEGGDLHALVKTLLEGIA